MSEDHEDRKYKYLVAYAADAIFIAFRGTKTLVDMADDLTMTRSPSKHGGKFHAGFLKRSDAFLQPNNKLDVLLRSGKRIILCGHSLGGAVAHMVLLRYILERDIMFTSDDPGPDESLFSIAFGAPHVCDRLAAGIINEDEHMNWRFINFVNQADPVPRFLDHLPNTLVTVFKGAPSYFSDCDSVLSSIGGCAGQLINSYATGQMPDLGKLAMRVGGSIVRRSWKTYIDKSSSQTEWFFRRFRSNMVKAKSEAEFHPLGQYVFLTKQSPKLTIDEWGPWKHKIEKAQNRDMSELNILIYCGEYCDLEFHTLSSYKSALIKASFLDGPQLITNVHHSHDLVFTPSPVIIKAQLDIRKLGERIERIRIEGRNLLFLYEPIRVNDDSKRWHIEEVSNTDLVLQNSAKGGMSEPFLTITIKTAFGRANTYVPVPVKGSAEAQETPNLLRTLVQVLFLKASSPMNHLPATDVLHQLDNIVQCATPLQNSEGNIRYLSPLISAISDADTDADMEADVTEHIKEANNMVEKVTNFLHSGRFESIDSPCSILTTRSEPLSSDSATSTSFTTWSHYLWRGSKFSLVCTAAVGAAMGCLAGGGVVVAGLTAFLPYSAAAETAILLGVVAPVSLSAGVHAYKALTAAPAEQRSRIRDEYLRWLELANEEASKWKSSAPGPPLDRARKPAAVYEKELVKAVQASKEFKEMVEHSWCNDHRSCSKKQCHNVQLRSQRFSAASHLTPKQLLQRVNVVLKTHILYEKVVSEEYVTVVGAEDAGKSTFIKKILEEFGPRDSVKPKTGLDYHTEDVKPYKVTKSLNLVDFPGGNGLGGYTHHWQQFNLLPGFAILFLDFKDDLKAEQKQMYETMKDGLEKNLIVVFNKVDERFTPDRQDFYTSTYFKEKKKKIALELNCDAKDVHYVYVRPNAFHTAETCNRMEKSGVLNLEQFADKVLDLKHTPLLAGHA